MAGFRATPYAKALHEIIVAEDAKRAEEMVTELERMAEAIEEVPDLLKVMVTPMVSTETKQAILDQVLETLALSDLGQRNLVHVRVLNLRGSRQVM